MTCFVRRSGPAMVVLALMAAPARADLITFQAKLLGTNEVPSNTSTATGFIIAILDDVNNTLTVDETFSGLVSPATAAHIHAAAPPGTNASVVLPFNGAAGFPTGVTAGSYHHVFNLATDLIGITVPDFITALKDGQAYANIHNATFPGGEIRGQLTAVPEPSALVSAALGAGSVGLIAVARRRRGK